MKRNYPFLLIFLVCSIGINAQIYPDRHTTNAYDGWVSCTKSNNPNTARGSSHWIRYDFGSAVPLHDMIIWNLNNPDYIKDGIRDAIIDVSSNGTTWTTIDTFTFPKAPASGFYEGFRGTDLGGVIARYLLITALNNHGGGCYGLSEMRVYTSNQSFNNLNFNFTLCENDGKQHNLNAGVGNGTYSGFGVTNNGNGTFDYDVNKVGPGIHDIKFVAGATTLNGKIQVLPCSNAVCRECKLCNIAEVTHVNGTPINSDIYNGYRILSTGQVQSSGDVRFMINDGAELNGGFQVNSTGQFLIDMRTCYNNLLSNSGFESGSTPWTLSQHNGAGATFTIDNSNPFEGISSARVQVTSTNGTDWHIQLNQGNVSITAGKKYRISFAARAINGGGPMAVILQLNASPWTVYADGDFILSEFWETYSFEFTANTTVSNLGIRALLGSTAGKTFWIDNFHFIPIN